MVIAHRGYGKFYKENTISAFEAAINAGAKGIECDVRLTADDQAVVHHNNALIVDNKKIKISKNSFINLIPKVKSCNCWDSGKKCGQRKLCITNFSKSYDIT